MNVNRNNLAELGHGSLPALAGDPGFMASDFVYEREAAGLIDLRKIWSSLWRHRYIALAICALSLAAGVLSIFLANPVYRATASIQIDDQPVKVLGTEDYQPVSGSQEADRLLQTQVDIISSRSLAQRVADSLNLAANDRFLNAMGVKPKPGIRHEQVISALRTNLVVTLPRNSRVVPVEFDSQSPTLAAKVANSYVENLIGSNLQRHFDTSKYSKEFLQGQLTLTKGRLEKSERALLSYARSVGIVDPTGGTIDPNDPNANSRGSLTTSNLVDFNQSLAAAKLTRIEAEGRWRQAQATPAMNLAEVLSNPAIQQMTQRRAELQSSYQQELQHRKADHPAVQQAAAAIKELNRQIATLAQSIKSSIRNQYKVALKQESEVSRTVGRLKGATLAEQSLGIRYNILKREVETNRQLYEGLLQRYKEVSAQAGVTSNNISVVDRAERPLLPISPNPILNMALAALLGIILAMLAVAALEIFHDGVRAPDEVEERFGLPLLGAVPLLRRSQAPREALSDAHSELSEAYQTVRASIELSSEAGSPRTLLVTSGRESEGKSTTALAIARTLAQSGQKVLLIDADMRRPSLHAALHVPRIPGLSNLLTQPIAAVAVIRETAFEGLSVLTAGPQPPSPAELLSGSRFRDLIHSLKDEYHHIIIDSPPVLGLADAPRLSALTDGTIMVIEANRSHRGAISAALRRLTSARANLLGAILVKFDPKKMDFGSNYLVSYYSYGTFGERGSDGAEEPSPA